MGQVGEPESCVCSNCGAKSPWKQGFVETPRVFRKTDTVCVTCWLYDRTYRGFYWRCGLWAAVALIGGYYLTGSPVRAALLAVALYACAYAAVVLHELGHAATALALGFRVAAFSLGGGLRTKTFRVRRTFVLLGPSPVEGLVLLGSTSARHYRKKMALVLLAGPGLNVLCAIGSFYLLAALSLSDTPRALASLWVAVNFVMILNLLPVVSRGTFGALRSDGLQLLDLFKLRDEEIERRVGASSLLEAYVAFQYGDAEQAHAAIAPALRAGFHEGRVSILATAILVNLGKAEEAMELARRSLDAENLGLEERGMLMNNLACALFEPDGGGLPAARSAEADELSAQAMDILPMANAVRATRGAVLVELGRYAEAVKLLADKRFRLEPLSNRVSVKASLAIALAGIGEAASAADELRAAAALCPGHPHVRRAQERLARSLTSDGPAESVANAAG